MRTPINSSVKEWNATISHTQQTAAIIPFCTAITQYNSYAIRSQSVLTTNSTGRVYNVQFECRAQHTSEIASIACLHNFFRHVLRVSNEKIDSHRFSGLASRCVEWFDPNIKRTNREAPSPSFCRKK